jgi:hypothetical protein
LTGCVTEGQTAKSPPSNNGDFTDLMVNVGNDPLPYLCESLTQTIRAKVFVNMEKPFGDWSDREFQLITDKWEEIELGIFPSFFFRLKSELNFNAREWIGVNKWKQRTHIGYVDDNSFTGTVTYQKYVYNIVSYAKMPGVYVLTNSLRTDVVEKPLAKFPIIDAITMMTNDRATPSEIVYSKLNKYWHAIIKEKTTWKKVVVSPYSRIYLITLDLHDVCKAGYVNIQEHMTGK